MNFSVTSNAHFAGRRQCAACLRAYKNQGAGARRKDFGTITQREHLVTIVYEELVRFFGKEKVIALPSKHKPFKIMMIGLFGSGKTTSAANWQNITHSEDSRSLLWD